MKYKNELEIDVFRCLRAIRRKKFFIILIALLCFVAGTGYTLEPGADQYTSKATVYAAANGSYADSTSAVNIMNAYVTIASSHKVCERASLLIGREDITADKVMRSVKVSTAIDNRSSNVNSFITSAATIITFSATSNEPELSIQMADAMASSYVIEMESILGNDSIRLLDSAYKYDKSVDGTKDAWKTRIISFLAGIFIGVVVVIFFEIFNKKVRTIREASIRGNLPVIGVIPDYKE